MNAHVLRFSHSRSAMATAGRAYAKGMTLVEVMVAAVILGFGVLGVAALQLSTMKVATESLSRSQVVMLTEFIADRMRSNPGGVASYEDLSCDKDACSITATANCDSSTCTPQQIAAKDAEEWRQELLGAASFLQKVTGNVVKDDEDVWTVRIFWNDSDIYGEDALNRLTAATQDCAPQSASNKASLQCYQVRLAL